MDVRCFFPDQERITRVDGCALTKETFAADFLHPHQPVMLMGLQSDWPAGEFYNAVAQCWTVDCWTVQSKYFGRLYGGCAVTGWQASSLRKRFGDRHFDITAPSGRVAMTMSDYLDFSERQCDEDPLYLFDAYVPLFCTFLC